MENNQIAVRIATNFFQSKVKAASRSYFAVQISEDSNQQVELFHIVRDLSRIGHSDWPPTSISPDQFAAF